jgi:4-hydroxy-tetrahydrodipicolinate synthase
MSITTSQLAGRLFPAVPVPFGRDGALHEAALKRYANWMADHAIGGVAIWAHTGRGLWLTDADLGRVITTWRSELPAESIVIAAAGPPPTVGQPDQVIARARSMARRAADHGAAAILVHPPTSFRDHSHRDELVLEYHARIAEIGLPLLLFYLYEAAGGISYPPQVLAELLARPEVLGIKIATLDSVMTFQDIAGVVKSQSTPKLVITGEDRFLGYSLMCGAEAALIGMAAACTATQSELLHCYWAGQSERFLKLSAVVDDLAQATFKNPMEGYIQRMLWCLVHQGVIPIEAAHDPWGPSLDPEEFHRVGAVVKRLESC